MSFAPECDCGATGGAYEAWPTCRECNATVCPACTVPGSLKTGESDHSFGDYTEAIHWETVECKGCALAGQEAA